MRRDAVRFIEDESSGRVGVGPGARLGELECVVDDRVDLGLDGLELGLPVRPSLRRSQSRRRAIGQRVFQASTSSRVR